MKNPKKIISLIGLIIVLVLGGIYFNYIYKSYYTNNGIKQSCSIETKFEELLVCLEKGYIDDKNGADMEIFLKFAKQNNPKAQYLSFIKYLNNKNENIVYKDEKLNLSEEGAMKYLNECAKSGQIECINYLNKK